MFAQNSMRYPPLHIHSSSCAALSLGRQRLGIEWLQFDSTHDTHTQIAQAAIAHVIHDYKRFSEYLFSVRASSYKKQNNQNKKPNQQ